MKIYELTIAYDSIFGYYEKKAWLKKKTKGYDYWIESSNGGKQKVTKGNKYLVGETLEDAIKNVEQGNDYAARKVIAIK